MGKRYKWYRNGKIFRETYDPEGEKVTKDFFPNGVTIRYGYSYDFSYVNFKIYKKGSYTHREDGPAVICYFLDGKVEIERYYKNGALHREDGPAVIRYGVWGSIRHQEYWEKGKRIE